MHKLVWSKQGWKRTNLTTLEIEGFSNIRNKLACEEEEIYNYPQSPEMRLIQETKDEIHYDCNTQNRIDELPGPLLDIVEQSSEWHIAGNKLFRVVDPIAQVKQRGHWGADQDDEDNDIFSGNTSTARLFLERANIIDAESYTEEVTDILGAVPEGYNIPVSPHGERVDIQIEDISTYKNGKAVTACEALPELSDSIVLKVREIHREFLELLSKSANDSEIEQLYTCYEQALNREIGHYISYPMNSKFCAHGYSQPRREHSFISLPKESAASDAASRRTELFYELFGEVAACSSMNDLYGPITKTTDKDGTVKYGRTGGFCSTIRDMYANDKQLNEKWSLPDAKRSKKDPGWKSAFEIAREEFIYKWRSEEKGDEELLRKTLWWRFDKVAKVIPAVYKDGKKIEDKKVYKDSVWRKKYWEALCFLNMTRSQWNGIYHMISVIKQRIKLQKVKTKDSIATIEILGKHFSRINNINDLNSYMEWATRRKFARKINITGYETDKRGKTWPIEEFRQTHTASLSMIDRISFLDEHLWRGSCAKKKRFLLQQLQMFENLRQQIKSSKPTSLPETTVVCLSPECNAVTIGVPVFYEIKDGQGLTGIQCEDCGKVVWLLGYREKIVLKALVEFEAEGNNE